MADTIGDLIDKLSIANIRLWHIEDKRREYVAEIKSYSAQDRDYWKERAKGAENLLKKVANVNKERNSLIDQINAALKVLVDTCAYVKADGTTHFEITAEELLGTGKNKFYKGEHE